MKKTILAGLVALLALTSCSYRLTDFTVISTRNVPIGDTDVTFKKADSRVKGVDKAHTVLCLPLGLPNMKEAIDRAIEQYPGAIGLADGVVKSKWWNLLIYGQSSYIVEGTPIYPEEIKNNKYSQFQSELAPQSKEVVEEKKATEEKKAEVKVEEKAETEVNVNDAPAGSTILFFHEVKIGDTLSTIAAAYNVTVAQIVKWNMLNSDKLKPGSKIRVFIK